MSRVERAIAWFPRGLRISEVEWDRRHRTLVVLLAVQIPVVFVFGLWRDYGVGHLALELAVPAGTVLLALAPRLSRRVRATAVTAGIVFLSAALVHLSGGYIEAHFHFFIMLGFIALYQDWFPFGWAIGFVVLSHGSMTLWDPDSMFNHTAAQERPFLWAGIHGAAVAFACAGQLTAWKAAEREAEEMARDRETAAAARRDAIARLYVDLSRRNGTLVENQLSVIDELEREVDDTDLLARLFELDHLTTRIRRNGESLLVVAGADPVVTRRRPMPLLDVARAAVSEVDQYSRVAVHVDVDTEIRGPAVRDLAHLLAELIENGTAFSPPATRVVVDARPAADGGVVITVEDRGLGMDAATLEQANRRLTSPEELTVDATRHLGHHVVAKLAEKHGVEVVLRSTDGGGTTAVVTLPAAVTVSAVPEPELPQTTADDAAQAEDTERAAAPAPMPLPSAMAVPTPSSSVPPPPPSGSPGGIGTAPATSILPPVAPPVAPPANAMTFSASGGAPKRGRSWSRPASTPPMPAMPPVDDSATGPPLPIRGQAGATVSSAPAVPTFVEPPMADTAASVMSDDGSPGLPTRRPGATQSAARATGLFGAAADEQSASDGGHTGSDASRAALRALSDYQRAQRAVRRADDNEES